MIKENTPTIETDRLILRKFNESDAVDLLKILSDKEVNTFLPWFVIKTQAEAMEFLKDRYLKYYERPSAYRYAICLKEDNKPIGYIGLGDGDSYDLGYGLRKEFWHKGIITEAARAVVKKIKEAGYSYITATHDIKNPHSGGVMKNIGMTYMYSYVEQVQPKNEIVTFRMYQLNFVDDIPMYMEYWNKYDEHFVEKI